MLCSQSSYISVCLQQQHIICFCFFVKKKGFVEKHVSQSKILENYCFSNTSFSCYDRAKCLPLCCKNLIYHKYHFSKQGMSWSLRHFWALWRNLSVATCLSLELALASPAALAYTTVIHTRSWWFICYSFSFNSRLGLFCVVLSACFSSTWALCAVMSRIWVIRCSQFHWDTWQLGQLT